MLLLLLLRKTLALLSKLLVLLLVLLLWWWCSTVPALLIVLLEGALIEDGALDLRGQRLGVDQVNRLTRMRWLRLLLLRQACPVRLRWHLRRTNLLARVLPVGGLLSMSEWEVWHLLRVDGCLSCVILMMGVVWLWSLCIYVVERRVQRLSILLLLQLLLLVMLLLILLRGLGSAIAPWLQNGQQGTTLVRLRHLVRLKALGSRLNLEKTL
jgi:hypothetical protein